MITTMTSTSLFTELFEKIGLDLAGSGEPWLYRLRQENLAQFESTGWPLPKSEDWKYTDLRRVLHETEFAIVGNRHLPANGDELPLVLPGDGINPRIVFVNGAFRPELSTATHLPQGVTLASFGGKLEDDPASLQSQLGRIDMRHASPLLALNTAFMNDGFVLHVSRSARVETPIDVVFIGGLADEPISYHPRHWMVLEDDSTATIVEHHLNIGNGTYLANSVTEALVGDGATLRHYKLQREGPNAVHLATVHAEVGREATFESFGLSTGSRLARQEITVRLAGHGAHCNVSGAYLLRDQQHCDTRTVIKHEVPGTSCREVFKGVVDDQARAVFQGKILIDRQAQKSDGHQMSKALLLSETAEADMKPELEIYADDVRCSHGASTGALDDNALYYLRSRGLTEPIARRLLIESFLKEALEEMSTEELRTDWLDQVSSWLTLNDKGVS